MRWKEYEGRWSGHFDEVEGIRRALEWTFRGGEGILHADKMRNRETRRELQVFLSARGLSIDDLAADVGAGPMTLHGFQTWLESNLDIQAKTQWVEGMNVARIIARELPVGFTGDSLAGVRQMDAAALDTLCAKVCSELRRTLGATIAELGNRGEQGEERTRESTLRALPGPLIARLWPATRVLQGLRVSQWLREELSTHAERVVFSARSTDDATVAGVDVSDAVLCRDLATPFLSSKAVELHAHTHVQHAPRILAALQKSLIDPQTSLAGPPKSLSAPQKATAMAVSTLDLSAAHIGEEGAAPLLQLLPACQALTHLDLTSCSIGDNAVVRLVRALSNCHGLKALGLDRNGMRAEGATALGRAMPGFSRLERLGLEGNQITEAGAQSVVAALKQCLTLADLDLSDQGEPGLGPRLVHALDGLRAASALTHLSLSRNALRSFFLLVFTAPFSPVCRVFNVASCPFPQRVFVFSWRVFV